MRHRWSGEGGAEVDAWRERVLRVTLVVTLGAGAIPLASMLLQALYPPHDWPAFWRILPVYLFVVLLLLCGGWTIVYGRGVYC